MKKNEFKGIEENKNKSNLTFIIIGIMAIVITGAIYGLKLQSQSNYTTFITDEFVR